MDNQISGIRIYVACLASYNNGILYGRWVSAENGLEHIQAEVRAMLETSLIENAEEYAIHDYDGFERISLSEYTGTEQVVEYADFIEEQGVLGGRLYEHFGNLEDAVKALNDHYAGEFESVSDFVEQITDENTTIPHSLTYYIDYEKMARDLEVNDIIAIETGFEQVHIFWQR